jgi:hypothetical protein
VIFEKTTWTIFHNFTFAKSTLVKDQFIRGLVYKLWYTTRWITFYFPRPGYFSNGLFTVAANDPGSVVYSYTLLVDGKIVDTKKLIKQ